jgi:phospholipid-binding lipoprotein MlaA
MRGAVFAAFAVLLAGCGSVTRTLGTDLTASPPLTLEARADVSTSDVPPISGAPSAPALTDIEPVQDTRAANAEAAAPAAGSDFVADAIGFAIAQAKSEPADIAGPGEVEQYDPWESFNEKMFNFNYNADKYVLKPIANGYRHVMPEPFQVLIANGFDNIRWVHRFVNNVLQAKWNGAGREMARFVINSTAGIGGLFDPAKDYWGIRPSKEDFGQTLGVWGSGPGPYLVLPLLPPMTVRDGIGMGVDGAMDPLSYFIPFIWDRLGMKIGDTINDRALNYELFQGVEETTLDLYSSVRHFYLQRREQQIKE